MAAALVCGRVSVECLLLHVPMKEVNAVQRKSSSHKTSSALGLPMTGLFFFFFFKQYSWKICLQTGFSGSGESHGLAPLAGMPCSVLDRLQPG